LSIKLLSTQGSTRHIPVTQIKAVNNELDKMLERDIIEEATEASPWVSNLVFVVQRNQVV